MSTTIDNETAKRRIAENVRRLLSDRGMSQKKLADMSGESAMMVSRIVHGLHIPGCTTLARIAEAFDVSIDRLIAKPPKRISK